MWKIALPVFLLQASNVIALPAQQLGPSSTSVDSFIELRNERRQLLDKIDDAKKEIERLETDQRTRAGLERIFNVRQEEHRKLLDAKPADPEEIKLAHQRMEEARSDLVGLSAYELGGEITRKRVTLRELESKRDSIEESINTLLNLEHESMFWRG
ncbi:MAG TPA: hypothetical protein VN181_05765, partial [Thermoanaerobaculia bacterium]|nr:hypothetical protein [Thermoanaerobaculia bacterium]